jgi:hypothetical protein
VSKRIAEYPLHASSLSPEHSISFANSAKYETGGCRAKATIPVVIDDKACVINKRITPAAISIDSHPT